PDRLRPVLGLTCPQLCGCGVPPLSMAQRRAATAAELGLASQPATGPGRSSVAGGATIASAARKVVHRPVPSRWTNHTGVVLSLAGQVATVDLQPRTGGPAGHPSTRWYEPGCHRVHRDPVTGEASGEVPHLPVHGGLGDAVRSAAAQSGDRGIRPPEEVVHRCVPSPWTNHTCVVRVADGD